MRRLLKTIEAEKVVKIPMVCALVCDNVHSINQIEAFLSHFLRHDAGWLVSLYWEKHFRKSNQSLSLFDGCIHVTIETWQAEKRRKINLIKCKTLLKATLNYFIRHALPSPKHNKFISKLRLNWISSTTRTYRAIKKSHIDLSEMQQLIWQQ